MEETTEMMVQEVMEYRKKGYLVTDETVRSIVQICKVKMEETGNTDSKYFEVLFKEGLKNYCFALEANLLSLRLMGAGPEQVAALI